MKKFKPVIQYDVYAKVDGGFRYRLEYLGVASGRSKEEAVEEIRAMYKPGVVGNRLNEEYYLYPNESLQTLEKGSVEFIDYQEIVGLDVNNGVWVELTCDNEPYTLYFVGMAVFVYEGVKPKGEITFFNRESQVVTINTSTLKQLNVGISNHKITRDNYMSACYYYLFRHLQNYK